MPVTGRRIPIVGDAYADPDKGTGAVKITPAHDFNDWGVGQRTGLRVINIMDTRATIALDGNADFAEGCPADMIARAVELFHGRDRYEARDALVTLAADEGWLDGIDADKHMVPHGDRSKVAIEPFLTDQWFVATDKIVGPALDAVRNGDTVILPERDTKTYFHWLENIEPWCISRQLWWGHQIPVWYGPNFPKGGISKTQSPKDDSFLRFVGANFDEIKRQAAAYYGTENVMENIEGEGREFAISNKQTNRTIRVGWDVEALEDDKFKKFKVSRVALQRDPDVLDTWFSSGLWPIGTLGWPENTPELQKYFPTSVLVTGFDIIFFWVARMMMMQLAVVNEVPFHTVYVHALVRDEKGKKMSKSLGNVLDPLELIDEYGADAVRFTVTAMAAMGRDLKLSTQRIAGYRNFGTKLWNACRFAEMNGVWDGHATAPVPLPKATVNRWIVGEVARAREAVDEALNAFRFDGAANALYAFVWGKVCDWYVEFAKPLFDSPDTAAETRETMAWVLDQCMILLHPIMPFVTEELWGTTGQRAKPLIHADWPTYGASLIDPAADREMNWVIALIEEIRSARAQMHVPVGLKLDMLQLSLDDIGRAAWARNEALIKRLARIESLTPATAAPKGALSIAVEGGAFAIPLEGIIDIAEEKARLAKTLEKLEKDLNGLRARLGNPKFLASAKEEVVDETRATLEQGEDEAAKLKAALRRLAEVG
jgi:valyl-tRNA synthetase